MDFSFVKKKKSVTGRKKFTREEDERLLQLVEVYGEYDWERIAATLGTRNARQCHDRWKFYINPQLNKSPFTREEDLLLISLVQQYGGMWVQISKKFHQRSDVQMKNRWKYLQKQMNLTMPVFNFPLQKSFKSQQKPQISPVSSSASISTTTTSSPYSPCVCDAEEKEKENKSVFSANLPLVAQHSSTIDSATNFALDNNIFSLSTANLFENSELFF